MIVRYSRRKLAKLLIILTLCSLAGAWATYQMFFLGNYVEPNNGRLVELGKVIARLTDQEWPFAAWLFLSCTVLLTTLTFVFLWVFVKRPTIIRIEGQSADIWQGWRKTTIAFSKIDALNLIEKKTQPHLNIEIEGQKPVTVHLGLADHEPLEIKEALLAQAK